MTTITAADTPLVQYTLRLADNALVLGHRLSRMVRPRADARGGHRAREHRARPHRPGAVALRACGGGRGRGPRRGRARLSARRRASYRNALLVEQPNGDFAVTIARQFLYAAFMAPFWRALAASPRRDSRGDRREGREGGRLPPAPRRRMADPPRRRHAPRAMPARRPRSTSCGCTPASCSRSMRSSAASSSAASPSIRRPCAPSGTRPSTGCSPRRRSRARPSRWMQTGGRAGRHSEHLGHILADLQFLQRAYPGAKW